MTLSYDSTLVMASSSHVTGAWKPGAQTLIININWQTL